MHQQAIIGADPTGFLAETVAVKVEVTRPHLQRLDAIAVQVNDDRRGAALGIIRFRRFFLVLFLGEHDLQIAFLLVVILDRQPTVDGQCRAVQHIGISTAVIGVLGIAFLAATPGKLAITQIDLARAVGIGNEVLLVGLVDVETVAAIERVPTLATFEVVFANATIQAVITLTAEEAVIAIPTDKRVIVQPAIEGIGPDTTIEVIGSIATLYVVISFATTDDVSTLHAEQEIISITALETLTAVSAEDDVALVDDPPVDTVDDEFV
ncbi:hypothetical protein J2S81_001189 [Pseudomonas otitidis]|nr:MULTISPECIES: hypothetical protein [Pseudomonas]MCP1616685.1 hypothetical protein [Pseudomonas otitidis]